MGISADIRGLDPSDLLGQPHWDRIAAYSQRWAESLANHPPHSISEQERLLNGHLAWQNWGGTLPPAPLGRLLVPQTFGRVAAAVCAAAAAGRRVRAVGKGHTWTPMFFDADGDTDVIFTTLLQLPSGQRVEMGGHSASGAPLLRIAAGVTVGELSQRTSGMLRCHRMSFLTASGTPA
ncbi:hypothetical protein WJX81_008283 [Elliptochloris bilobata]|uniref:Uncharacterized protein n=1 Tax=Elliptochloris bilobata TaxID=381761 RepID=A0AAW1RU30_9CHLO